MRIRFTNSVAGSFGGYATDDVADLPDADALGLIRAGHAVLDEDEAAMETTIATPAVSETAATKFRRQTK